jgi:hypothetical protein
VRENGLPFHVEYAGQRGMGHSIAAVRSQLADLKEYRGVAQLINAQAAIELIVTYVGCVASINTLQDLKLAQKLLAGA